MEILMKKADASHGLTMNEILGELAARGIDAERKSVSRDFDVLRDYGFDVLFDSSTKRWFLAERPFSAEELVMLVDAVQSAPFLTEHMALGLVKKLKRFASVLEYRCHPAGDVSRPQGAVPLLPLRRRW